MLTSFRQKKASLEVIKRKNRLETYTEPLLTKDGDNAKSQEELEEIKAFLADFYKTIYKRRPELEAIIQDHPNSVGMYYKQVVPNQVTHEDFWQRYFYRCDQDRIVRQLQLRAEHSRQFRNEVLSESVENVKSLWNKTTPRSASDAAIVSSSGNQGNKPGTATPTLKREASSFATSQMEQGPPNSSDNSKSASKTSTNVFKALKNTTNKVRDNLSNKKRSESSSKQGSRSQLPDLVQEDTPPPTPDRAESKAMTRKSDGSVKSKSLSSRRKNLIGGIVGIVFLLLVVVSGTLVVVCQRDMLSADAVCEPVLDRWGRVRQTVLQQYESLHDFSLSDLLGKKEDDENQQKVVVLREDESRYVNKKTDDLYAASEQQPTYRFSWTSYSTPGRTTTQYVEQQPDGTVQSTTYTTFRYPVYYTRRLLYYYF